LRPISSEPAILGGVAPKPPRGDDPPPLASPAEGVADSSVWKKGVKGGVRTLLRRLKPHLALFTKSDSLVQTAFSKAIALVPSASPHPCFLKAIEVFILLPATFG